jgi:hypothetical protein
MLTMTLACALCAQASGFTFPQLEPQWSELLAATTGDLPNPDVPGSSVETVTTRWALSAGDYWYMGTLAAESGITYSIGLGGSLPAGRLAVDWGGAFAATLPVAALLAAISPTLDEKDHSFGYNLAWLGLMIVAVPAAGAGGVAAAEALAGHSVQGPAFWNAVGGGLIGVGVAVGTQFLIRWIVPSPGGASPREPTWGEYMLEYTAMSLVTSAATATCYAYRYSSP